MEGRYSIQSKGDARLALDRLLRAIGDSGRSSAMVGWGAYQSL